MSTAFDDQQIMGNPLFGKFCLKIMAVADGNQFVGVMNLVLL